MTNSSERQSGVDKSKLLEAMNGFPQQSIEFIAYLSSIFIEPDVYKNHREDPDAVKGIARVLGSHGLPTGDVQLVLTYFEFKTEDIESAIKENGGTKTD